MKKILVSLIGLFVILFSIKSNALNISDTNDYNFLGNILIKNIGVATIDDISPSAALLTLISTNVNYSVTTNDCNKMIVYTGATTNTFYLPSVGAGDLGTHFWFSKVGTGKMIINSRIADSGVNGTIYNASTNESYATMHLMAAATNQWVVGGFFGTWTTTTP